jgi:hypothetical protein
MMHGRRLVFVPFAVSQKHEPEPHNGPVDLIPAAWSTS